MNSLKLGSVVVLLLCIFSVLTGCLPGSERPNPKIAQTIAPPLRIDGNWKSIREYLQKNLTPGVSKEDVHNLLAKIGPYKITFADDKAHGGWDSETNQYVFREIISFVDPDTRIALKDWGMYYNENDHLVKAESLDS